MGELKMTKKQQILFVGIVDLFVMICAIAALALHGILFYVLEAIFAVIFIFDSVYIYNGCKELANNGENNDFKPKTHTLAKYIIFASFIFAIIITTIIIIALR